MRSCHTLAAVSGLLLSASTIAATTPSECTKPCGIASLASCGDSKQLITCLHDGTLTISDCLTLAGCTPAEVVSFETWFPSACGQDLDTAAADLRRRHAEPVKRVAQPLAAEATAAPAENNLSPRATAAPLPGAAIFARADDDSTLECLTTSMIPTTWCIPAPAPATGTTCIPTETPSIRCAPGLYCQTEDSGATICMKKVNTPDLSGIIVSSVLAAFAVAMFGSLCVMSWRSAATTRRARKQQEAMAIAGGMKQSSGGKRQASEAYLPLMEEQGPAGGVPAIRGHSPAPSTGRRDYASGEVRPPAGRSLSASWQDVGGQPGASAVSGLSYPAQSAGDIGLTGNVYRVPGDEADLSYDSSRLR